MGFLDGVKVIDATRLLPGGYCTMLLSDLGAEVIKVEQPGLGDYMRATPPTKDGRSPVHSMANRNKLSIGIDLKKEGGKQVLAKLLKTADVFLEGFRPGVMARLGFSFERVRAINPGIVYCSISAFGQTSARSRMPGHDINFQAMAGTLGYQTKPEVPMVQLGDLSSGMHAALNILAALAKKKEGGVYLDVPIVPSLLSWALIPASAYLATGESPTGGHSLVFGSDSYYNIFSTRDGKHVAVAAIEEQFWKNLVNLMGVPELESLRYGTPRERAQVTRTLKRVFASKTRDQWAEILMDGDTCATPVLTLEEVLGSAWARDAGSLLKVKGDGVVLNNPVKSVPPQRSSPFSAAPSLGQHTAWIMKDLGYSHKEIARLKSVGAVQ